MPTAASNSRGPRRRLYAWPLLLAAFLPANAPGAEPADPEPRPASSIVVPFEYRRGHALIPVRVSGTNAHRFILDTGYSMTMLPPGLGDALQLRRAGHVTIVGIAGEEQASVFDGPQLDFGGLLWTSRRVAAFPTTEPGRGRRREGILGSGFFRRFVVVIDQRAKTIELREPDTFKYAGDGEILPLRFRRGSSTPIVSVSLNAPGGIVARGELELDTGCDGCLCLASDFSEKNRLVPADSRSSSRSGVGGGTRTRAGRLDSLELGRFHLDRPAAEFFVDGSPAGDGLAGHLGLEALRDFRAILDYSRQRLILEPQVSKGR